MDYIARIQQGIDYCEAHLDADLPLAQVAQASAMSLWHFQRMFKALAGETVKTYIRHRRLHLAMQELLESDHKILDIALKAGFDSQESFTRAFKKAFDTTPAQYREAGIAKIFLNKIRINENYLRHINRGLSMQPEIYDQHPMSLVGLRTDFIGAYSELNNVSEKLPPLWQAFLPRLGEIRHAVGGLCYGVVRQIAADADELEYFCAMEVSEAKDIPPGMVHIDIPARRYAKFRHQGDIAKIDDTINYIYSTWLPQSGKRHTYDPDLEFYGADYIPNSDASVMHYAIPIE